MFCCRAVYTIKRQVLSFFYSKEPGVTQTVTAANAWGAEIDIPFWTMIQHGNLVITKLQSVSLDNYICKYKIWKEFSILKPINNEETHSILTTTVDAPWLWVGAKYFGGVVDMTNSLKPYLVSGNILTPNLLTQIFPAHRNWVYLDPVTLKEVEFPAEGITINAA